MDNKQIIESFNVERALIEEVLMHARAGCGSSSAYDAVKASIIAALTQARADERERCASVCEEMTASWTEHDYNQGCMACANAIRKMP